MYPVGLWAQIRPSDRLEQHSPCRPPGCVSTSLFSAMNFYYILQGSYLNRRHPNHHPSRGPHLSVSSQHKFTTSAVSPFRPAIYPRSELHWPRYPSLYYRTTAFNLWSPMERSGPAQGVWGHHACSVLFLPLHFTSAVLLLRFTFAFLLRWGSWEAHQVLAREGGVSGWLPGSLISGIVGFWLSPVGSEGHRSMIAPLLWPPLSPWSRKYHSCCMAK